MNGTAAGSRARSVAATKRYAWPMVMTSSAVPPRSDGAILMRDEVGSKDCRAETRWHETAFRNVAASLAEITGLSQRAA
jgi:hypothetical protein